MIVNDMKKNLESNFKEKSMNKIQNRGKNGKLTTYRSFKNSFIGNHIYQRLRTALTIFRLSAHNLAVERGRHTKPKIPLSNRIK